MDYEQDYAHSQQAQGVIGHALSAQARPPSAQTASARKQTPAEQIRDNAERAVSRLTSVRSRLEDLRSRLCGAAPTSTEKEVSGAMNASGFINETGSAIERAHIEITEIDQLLAELSQVI